MTYKVGDRVRIKEAYGPIHAGATATLTEAFATSTPYLRVQWDDSSLGYANGGYRSTRFEKIKPEKPKAAPKPKKPSQAYKGNGKHTWEIVNHERNSIVARDPGTVWRLRVPGGWLYGKRIGASVFVPMPAVVNHKV